MEIMQTQEPDVTEFVAAHPEIAEAAADHVLENPENFLPDVVAKAKERRGARKANSAGITAVVKMAEDISAADELYGDGMPYELERIENEVRFCQDQAGAALLEMGKRLIRIKAHEGHGKFLESLERLDMAERSAQYAMLAARKFSNTHTCADLPAPKVKALTVLDEDEIKTLEAGGKVRGMSFDDIDRMGLRELRENLRREKEKARKEKEARKKEREAFEKSMTQKDAKINELDMKLSGMEPPTREQIAGKILEGMNRDYTVALGEVCEAVRKALALVVKAERIEGVNAQQLSEWLGQFDGEMRAFHELREAWTGEADTAGPTADGDER